jgi:hypothetical protein
VVWVVLVSLAILLCCVGALHWFGAPSTEPPALVQAERRPAGTTVRVLRGPDTPVAFTRPRAQAVPAAEAEGVAAPEPTWDGGDVPSRDFVRARVVALVDAREPDHPLRSAELGSSSTPRCGSSRRSARSWRCASHSRRMRWRGTWVPGPRCERRRRGSRTGLRAPGGEVVNVLEKEIERRGRCGSPRVDAPATGRSAARRGHAPEGPSCRARQGRRRVSGEDAAALRTSLSGGEAIRLTRKPPGSHLNHGRLCLRRVPRRCGRALPGWSEAAPQWERAFRFWESAWFVPPVRCRALTLKSLISLEFCQTGARHPTCSQVCRSLRTRSKKPTRST